MCCVLRRLCVHLLACAPLFWPISVAAWPAHSGLGPKEGLRARRGAHCRAHSGRKGGGSAGEASFDSSMWPATHSASTARRPDRPAPSCPSPRQSRAFGTPGVHESAADLVVQGVPGRSPTHLRSRRGISACTRLMPLSLPSLGPFCARHSRHLR